MIQKTFIPGLYTLCTNVPVFSFGNICGAAVTVRYKHISEQISRNRRLKGRVNRIKKFIVNNFDATPMFSTCKADFNGDHKVDNSDLNIFSFVMGELDCIRWPALCDCDTDGDNDVDGTDLGVLAVEFGRTDCP